MMRHGAANGIGVGSSRILAVGASKYLGGATMASVSVRQVEKTYGKTTKVIHGISVDIADGEFCVLVGPSGCGKSTLLRMIAGLEEISGGEILIGDRVVNDVAPKERDIAMVFQNYALYPHMTVRDNMAFSLMLAKREKSEIDRRVGEASSILGLNDYLDRFPRQLSGGQRQRVAMGRAIVRNPQVFLFDEPLSNLDAKLRVQMRTEIKALHQRLKTTAIYVTHDQIEAMTMADKIVVLRDGIIEQVGAPLDLYDNPVNTFVAQFIGSPSMNLIKGTVADGAIQLGEGGKVALPNALKVSEGQQLTFGMRPEHFEISTGTEGIAALVHVIEPTGADTQVVFKVGQQEVVVVARDRVHCKAGDAIRLVPDMKRAHWFDGQTGKRLV
jgi:multiple sugar transport system ATP-binding protein